MNFIRKYSIFLPAGKILPPVCWLMLIIGINPGDMNIGLTVAVKIRFSSIIDIIINEYLHRIPIKWQITQRYSIGHYVLQ